MRQVALFPFFFRLSLVAIWMVLNSFSPVFGQSNPIKVAVFTPGETLRQAHQGLQQGLARLGYISGHNAAFLVDDTKGKYENLLARAKKLVGSQPDALFTVTTGHTAAGQE